jgi:hypothetical protein
MQEAQNLGLKTPRRRKEKLGESNDSVETYRRGKNTEKNSGERKDTRTGGIK